MITKKENEMKRALNAMFLQLPEAVANDIKTKVLAAFYEQKKSNENFSKLITFINNTDKVEHSEFILKPYGYEGTSAKCISIKHMKEMKGVDLTVELCELDKFYFLKSIVDYDVPTFDERRDDYFLGGITNKR